MLKTLFYQKEKIFYDGSQLFPGWIDHRFGLKGDALVSFIGGCDVEFEHMVDLADLAQKNPIKSDLMLHFLGEFFSCSNLYFSFALQRLFVMLIKDSLENLSGERLLREGDDLYLIREDGKSKLTVSVATVSPRSSLFHLGINISESGTPLKVATLKDLGLTAEELAPIVLKDFLKEYQNICEESRMVRKVGEDKK